MLRMFECSVQYVRVELMAKEGEMKCLGVEIRLFRNAWG